MFLILACISCASKLKITDNQIITESNPKLIFLNYKISKNDSGEKSIQFIDKKIVDGKLRNKSSKYINSGAVGDLVCVQLDNNKKTLSNQIISNPLLKSIEFTTDSLSFKKRRVSIKQTSLNLRIQLNPATKFIRIKEIIDSLQNTKTLIISSIE
ncbi:hypothetical protein [Algibacter sp. L4_22]|uniref:hypothetical protein n=1 Tax=Algibacter sp. L4_22 TaxID=2942477 RepID=UPI00201B7D41|nr:hypothetical protein [Algibacter sp. L4_22]MCL5130131.1 hypothetical protein [Algibacter sp. L4_22]